MNVKIYEEITELPVFPEITDTDNVDKDDNITKFSKDSVDLYLEKKASELRIYCYLLARKGSERPKGYYVKSISKFAEDSFTEFKKESNKALHKLGLEYRPDDNHNIIFDNIEKLDLDTYSYEDVDLINHLLDTNQYMVYKGGNIEEISIFCKDILKKIDNAKICISPEETKLGDVNIIRSQKPEEPLIATEVTKQILDKYREELIEKRRIEEGGHGKEKITNGCNSIIEGISILRNSGYNPDEIYMELDKVWKVVSEYSNKIKLNENKKKDKNEGLDRGLDIIKTISQDIIKRPKLYIVVFMLILIFSSLIFHFPINLQKSDKKPIGDSNAIDNNSNINMVNISDNQSNKTNQSDQQVKIVRYK